MQYKFSLQYLATPLAPLPPPASPVPSVVPSLSVLLLYTVLTHYSILSLRPRTTTRSGDG